MNKSFDTKGVRVIILPRCRDKKILARSDFNRCAVFARAHEIFFTQQRETMLTDGAM
jgi:hypothetical protein